jgi:hypothetical protein
MISAETKKPRRTGLQTLNANELLLLIYSLAEQRDKHI